MRPHVLYFLLLLGCAACTPVRTVYDSQGNVVKEDEEPGGEKDLMSTFEKRFDAAFSEKKTQDGVPMTTSSKVSPFQQELDNARKINKTFSTGNFDTGSRLDLRGDSFAGAAKRFNTGKDGIAKAENAMYSTDLRPDFMNESHGISHSQRYKTDSSQRSSMEGRTVSTSNYWLDNDEPYTTSTESGYIETRRNKAGQPTIIDHKDYYRQFRGGLKGLLGTENSNTP